MKQWHSTSANTSGAPIKKKKLSRKSPGKNTNRSKRIKKKGFTVSFRNRRRTVARHSLSKKISKMLKLFSKSSAPWKITDTPGKLWNA